MTLSTPPSLKLRHLWPVADRVEYARRKSASGPAAFVPTFRGAAREAQTITAHEWMIAGPAETGKTFAALWRLDTLCRTTPRGKFALVRKTYADIPPTVLATYRRVIELSKSGATPFGGEKPEWYDYPNGARLFVGGMDRPGKVLSGERDGVYVNQAEELSLEDWETLTTRATGRGAVTATPMIFGDCNPGPEYHWILNRPSLRVLHSRHEDNPTLYDDRGQLTEQGRRSLAILDALTGLRYKRLRLGLWVGAEGQVYEEFDPAIHVIDRFDIPDSWPRYRSIDFGYSNPFSCSWWARDPDGRLYRYRQIYMTGRTVRAHAEKIKALSAGENIVATVADHDAEDRATLAEHGINTIPADKRISIGIEKVQERLRVAGDGKPRIYFLRDALVEADESLRDKRRPLDTVQEFAAYVWPKGVDGKANKEAPVDDNNHGLDELRYLVMHFDGPRPHAASLVDFA